MKDETENKLRIFFLLPSLEAGGTERVFVTIVNHLDRKRFVPTVVLLEQRGEFLNDLDKDVRVISLNAPRVRHSISKIIRLVKAEQPDLIFTGMLHLSLWTITFRSLMPRATKFMARETTIVSVHYKSSVLEWMIKRFYRNFDKIICQSGHMKEDLVKNYHLHPDKAQVINNPVDSERVLKLANSGSIERKSAYNIVAVGRLIFEKGYDILLDAMSILVKNGEDVTLKIVGDGPLSNELKSLAKTLGIDNRVEFYGFQANPYPFIASSDLFVLSSRYDGFPNAVLESHVCGTPVVALKCPGAIDEIIVDGENGWLELSANATALASKITYAKDHPIERARVRESALRRYSIKNIITQYEEVFEKVTLCAE